MLLHPFKVTTIKTSFLVEQEFIRVGYYVNNEYADEELRENPPEQPRVDRVVRNILAEKPRVTRFPCEFDTPAIPAVPATPQVEVAPGYAHMEETPEMAQAQHAE